MSRIRHVVVTGLAIVVVSGILRYDAAAQQPGASGAATTGLNAGRLAELDAEASRLRPELLKRFEALPGCIAKGNSMEAKLACIGTVRKIVAEYFDTEIAIRQDWVDRDELELREIERRVQELQARSVQEKATAARRESVDLLAAYVSLQDDLRARMTRELQSARPDRQYISSLEETIKEYDHALAEVRQLHARAERPGFLAEKALANLQQYKTYAEARLRYVRAHRETYVLEQEVAFGMLTLRESEIQRDSISERPRGRPVPDTEGRMGGGPKASPEASLQLLRYESVTACRNANPAMTEDQCAPHVQPQR